MRLQGYNKYELRGNKKGLQTVLRGSPVRGDSPGKNTGVDCHVLLGNLPDPGIKPAFPASADGFFTTSTTWELESNANHVGHINKYAAMANLTLVPERNHQPTSKVRSNGREEIHHVQGEEQLLHFAGAAVKRYPTSKVGFPVIPLRKDFLDGIVTISEGYQFKRERT
ncbi:hypothetical protein MG293_000783 [Ovis ammon polii]|uniref:Uncharacterized protein n=1 Tax=Ovis ammon polii TaxID=230172 RepID=A0AAD4ULE0_OVIAM|nr:hypothetical protein MG293_000783 [Ovis ammon polii]